MARFRYARDPLCLLGCAAYVLNRWLIAPHVPSAFLRGQFDDLWLIPCALPPVLWLYRRLALRGHDGFPGAAEIFLHWLLWSFLLEGVGPRLLAGRTGDPLDVVAYGVGAVAAWLWWRRSA